MSTNIIPLNVAIPAHLANRIGPGKTTALSTAISGGLSNGPDYPRISIKGSRFRIVEDGTEIVLPDTTLSVVVVGANPNLSKTWYAEAWSPDADPTSPDCYSLDGIRPAADSGDPQNDLCASCPQNAWGSKVTPQGTKIKACGDQKRLAVVPADDAGGPIYLLQVTPAALKGLGQYHKELSARGIAPDVVRTKISFDTSASFPKLTFGFDGFLDEETQGIVDTLFGSDKVKEITGEVTAPVQPTKAPVKATAPKPEPQPEPEPEPAASPEQAPKRGFGAKAAAPAQAASTAAGKGFGKAKAETKPKTAAAAPVNEPAQAATVSSNDDLATEIANLIGETADDGA